MLFFAISTIKRYFSNKFTAMYIKLRHEFKKNSDFIGWINTSGQSHIINQYDIFIKPIKWGLFVWNENSSYPIENAISVHLKEVNHNNLVCRPIIFL